MQVKNTVNAGPYSFIAKGSNRPFGNDFVLQSAEVVQYNGQDEVACVVLCTATSKEPGRQYFVQYSTKGQLMEARTLN